MHSEAKGRGVILATAFMPFGAAETNASEDLLRALGEDGEDGEEEDAASLVRVVLPTEYDRAQSEIVRLIRELRPAAVVCFGVASGADRLRLERVARNRDESAAPDNSGDIRNGQAILPGAPDLYQATLPCESIGAALDARGIPYAFSDSAGGYVCNHTFFCALHEIRQMDSGIPCGFVHVPPIKTPEEFAGLLEAMKICIDLAREAAREVT